MFASSFTKRYVMFQGNSRINSAIIWKIDAATSQTAPPVSRYIDFNALNSSWIPSTNIHSSDWMSDSAWDQIGKSGLGGLAISNDQKTLYTVNLFNKDFVAISIGSPAKTTITLADITTYPIPTVSNCPASDIRPFAVEVIDSKPWISLTCTAESTQLSANLWAYLYSFNVTTATWTQEANFSLAYTRPGVSNACSGCTCNSPDSDIGAAATFLPWKTTVTRYCIAYSSYMNPQPLVSAISRNDHGNLIVSV